MTQVSQSVEAPKRFYKMAEVTRSDDGGFAIALDGRAAKTPKRLPLATPYETLANAVAEEWNIVENVIDTSHMPLTKLLSTLIDLGEFERSAWTQEILNFLQSDLLCYRASEPATLVERQDEIWNPFADAWATRFGAKLNTTTGVMAVKQSDEAVAAAAEYLDTLSVEQLLAAKAATELAGSAVLAMALVEAPERCEEIFAASRLDEHFQEERWGSDAEAKAREANLKRDFKAAAAFIQLSLNENSK